MSDAAQRRAAKRRNFSIQPEVVSASLVASANPAAVRQRTPNLLSLHLTYPAYIRGHSAQFSTECGCTPQAIAILRFRTCRLRPITDSTIRRAEDEFHRETVAIQLAEFPCHTG